jgi:hypothetical protein
MIGAAPEITNAVITTTVLILDIMGLPGSRLVPLAVGSVRLLEPADRQTKIAVNQNGAMLAQAWLRRW